MKKILFLLFAVGLCAAGSLFLLRSIRPDLLKMGNGSEVMSQQVLALSDSLDQMDIEIRFLLSSGGEKSALAGVQQQRDALRSEYDGLKRAIEASRFPLLARLEEQLAAQTKRFTAGHLILLGALLFCILGLWGLVRLSGKAPAKISRKIRTMLRTVRAPTASQRLDAAQDNPQAQLMQAVQAIAAITRKTRMDQPVTPKAAVSRNAEAGEQTPPQAPWQEEETVPECASARVFVEESLEEAPEEIVPPRTMSPEPEEIVQEERRVQVDLRSAFLETSRMPVAPAAPKAPNGPVPVKTVARVIHTQPRAVSHHAFVPRPSQALRPGTGTPVQAVPPVAGFPAQAVLPVAGFPAQAVLPVAGFPAQEAELEPALAQASASPLNRYEREQEQQDMVKKLARRGSTPSEISRRLKMSQEEVEIIIRLGRTM